MLLAALRRFRGPAVFRGLRPSLRQGVPFWPSGLTLRSSGRLRRRLPWLLEIHMKSVKKSNKKFAEKLASVPIEYQASVYAKEIKLQHQEKQIENKENLAKHRSLLKSLEKKFQEEKSEESRAILLNEIEIQKKIIKRAPRPKRNWSPILSGSFESNSR